MVQLNKQVQNNQKKQASEKAGFLLDFYWIDVV